MLPRISTRYVRNVCNVFGENDGFQAVLVKLLATFTKSAYFYEILHSHILIWQSLLFKSSLSQIIEAMDHAVNKDDVQHIIIDNLQFMMPVASNQVGYYF